MGQGRRQGFTLIEMSIVLVIIGLIVGGVLAGQDLIGAAAVRAQMTQIEKYNQAINTFKGKYGQLPGDMDATTAAQFGFISRAAADSNSLDWTNFSAYFPSAKIGNGNFVMVYSTGDSTGISGNSQNYFDLSSPSVITGGNTVSLPALTVKQAYTIDTKIDDGLPTSGRILAQYLTGGASGYGMAPHGTTDTTSTCYNSSVKAYSILNKQRRGRELCPLVPVS